MLQRLFLLLKRDWKDAFGLVRHIQLSYLHCVIFITNKNFVIVRNHPGNKLT